MTNEYRYSQTNSGLPKNNHNIGRFNDNMDDLPSIYNFNSPLSGIKINHGNWNLTYSLGL